MKKAVVSFALASVAILAMAACTKDVPTAPSASPGLSGKLPSYDIGIASASQVQVCLLAPNGPLYTLDASNITGNKGTDDLINGSNISMTPGSCVIVVEKDPNEAADNPPDNNIWMPVYSTPVMTASVPGTWSYSCVSPEPLFCPAPPNNSGNSTQLLANRWHGSTVTFIFTPASAPCPAGNFLYTMSGGDLLISYDQFPAPNDNSYGVNAVGWGSKGHKFGDLVGSDHAGFQLKDPNGVVKLSFNVDYISVLSSAPSGYASLGVTGGEGKMLVGTADGISATTSFANNLNNINIPGLFNPVTHVQQIGSVNVLIDSPPVSPANTYNNTDPALAGWDFHNTYYVTISAAKLASLGFDASTWTVEPNADQLHNSPAKACPADAGGSTPCNLTTTKWEVKDKQVKITVANGASAAVYLTQLAIDWPFATNGKITKIKFDGDVVYDNPDLTGGSATLVLAQLVADQNKRKIDKASSDVITFEFEKNADPNLANYTANLLFGDCPIALLPH